MYYSTLWQGVVALLKSIRDAYKANWMSAKSTITASGGMKRYTAFLRSIRKR
jgi:hypothetical protein